jgi:hypothetical protein
MLELDHLHSLGYAAEELAPRIFSVDNFASAEEIAKLHAEAAAATEEEWNFRYMDEMRKNAHKKFGRDDVENLVKEGLLEVTSTFADKNLAISNGDLVYAIQDRSEKIFALAGDFEITGFIVHQRLYAGSQLTAHFDQYSDKLVQYAAVLYINDDYVDGEIFFPGFDLKLRPTPGTLLIFPGTSEYVHGVHQVGEGPVRYVIPAFIKTRHPNGSMAGWADFG